MGNAALMKLAEIHAKVNADIEVDVNPTLNVDARFDPRLNVDARFDPRLSNTMSSYININNTGLLVVTILLIFQGADPNGSLHYLLSLSFGICIALAIGIGVAGIIWLKYNNASLVYPETKIIAPTRLILVGNPGVGKSTTLNGLVGKAVFASGFSCNSLTRENQSITHMGNIFVDTPGLSDYSTNEKAADEITKALRNNAMNGNMKLIFVVKLECGRVRGSDTGTIGSVLDALPQDTKYGIIVNQVSQKFFEKLLTHSVAEGTILQKVDVCLNQGRENKTPNIHYFPLDAKLSDKDNVVHTTSSELIHFINSVPPCSILKDSDIEQVNGKNMEQMSSENGKKINELLKDKDKMGKEFKVMEEVHKKELEEVRNKVEAEMKERSQEAVDKCVGPIFSNAYASAVVNKWLAKNLGWKWNGHWVSKHGTSYAGMIRTR